MLSSLRARLLISYIVIVSLNLCFVGTAVILLLAHSPIPVLQAYQQLTNIGIENEEILTTSQADLESELSRIAVENDIRVLHITSEGAVIFDSSGEVNTNDSIDLRALRERFQPDAQRIQRGIIQISGTRWLYVALRMPKTRDTGGMLVFATPRKPLTIFEAPGSDLLRILLQAGIISLTFSILLAVLISRSVARPLRRVASASNAVAKGDYDQKIEEDGPQEVRDLAKAFNGMIEQVQSAQKTQRDFLANVSHELKTPLTSIQGYSQAILDGAAAEPTRAAQVIYDEAGRMRRMVEELLDLARIESGQTKLRREYVNLQDLLTSVLNRFVFQAEDRRITLISEVGELPVLTGDNDRLAQVFANLVDNALTHTPPGGTITVRAEPFNNGVQVVVSDTGKGIPQEDLSRIFERFYQIDKSRARSGRKGTGLGLAISKEIVEVHSGIIQAESPVGQGAKFVVWLPLPRHSDETLSRIPRQD